LDKTLLTWTALRNKELTLLNEQLRSAGLTAIVF
jgi:hypothetical protein